jgi:hypothetical protein
MYSPLIEYIEHILKSYLRWFLTSFLFCTVEMQNEVARFFDTGKTSFRLFEWLNISYIKRLFPERWHFVFADFLAAYLKMALLSVFVCMACAAFIKAH